MFERAAPAVTPNVADDDVTAATRAARDGASDDDSAGTMATLVKPAADSLAPRVAYGGAAPEAAPPTTIHGCDARALREARVDLAACYRVLDALGLNEGIDNHLTAMVPGTDNRFLCVAYGLAWAEVTASNLLLLDAAGTVLQGDGAPDPTASAAPASRRAARVSREADRRRRAGSTSTRASTRRTRSRARSSTRTCRTRRRCAASRT